MYDEIRCYYQLPVAEGNTLLFQTKDTPAQMLDLYEIRKDGTLWHEAYDIGFGPRVNKRWEPEHMTGEIQFYHVRDDGRWIEFQAYFTNGRLQELSLIHNFQEETA